MKITVDYLENWEDENEEDVFSDGPFCPYLHSGENLAILIFLQ